MPKTEKSFLKIKPHPISGGVGVVTVLRAVLSPARGGRVTTTHLCRYDSVCDSSSSVTTHFWESLRLIWESQKSKNPRKTVVLRGFLWGGNGRYRTLHYCKTKVKKQDNSDHDSSSFLVPRIFSRSSSTSLFLLPPLVCQPLSSLRKNIPAEAV